MPQIKFITTEKSIRTKNNPSGNWTLQELIIFSINNKTKIKVSDCGIEIDNGELKKL